jgi:hypothetical protein
MIIIYFILTFYILYKYSLKKDCYQINDIYAAFRIALTIMIY